MNPIDLLNRRAREALAAGFVVMVGLIVGYGLMLANDSQAWTAQDIAYFGTMAIATLLCAARATLIAHQRTAWVLMTGVVLGNLVAELLYYYLELPFPSLADAIWLFTYVLLLAALVALIAPMIKTDRRLLLLDWLIATCAVSAAAVVIFLSTILNAQPDVSLGSVISVSYPIADVVILAALLVVLFAGARSKGPAILLVVGAGLVWLISDAIYSYQTATGTGDGGGVLDLTWPVALALLAGAAWAPATLSIDRLALRRRASVLSGVCVLIALGVLIFLDFRDSQDLAAFIFAILAVAGGGIRLIMAQRENRRLLEFANTDHLTGIPSRARLAADAESHAGSPLTVLMLDLDGFKFYNDSFGHPAGDVLLQRIAARLVEAAGEAGDAYRIGGDEFCVLLRGRPGENQKKIGALKEAARIRGEGFEITTSMGCSEFPAEADDLMGALSLADERMYAHKNQAKTSARSQVHEVLVRSLREREPGIADHTGRVRDLSLAVAREMVDSSDELDVIERAAELHDVGKVAIPDSILSKPEDLTPEEWDLMKQHTLIGERIIAASPALAPVAKMVRSSHEHWDGSGYPDALKGAEIPLGSRIILACDALEAMVSERPYSRSYSLDQALTELERSSGTHFDPEVVSVLTAQIRSGRLQVIAETERISQPLDKWSE